jgi:hypothetical protein
LYQENFCPNCGQENKDQKVSLPVFIGDFLSNYLSFDSSLFKTLLPFFFLPGKLTRTFIEGKRKLFLHPIRLYLIASLFYFFLIGLVVPVSIIDDALNNELDLKSSFIKVSVDTTYTDGENPVLLPHKNDTTQNTLSWNELKLMALDNNISNEEFESNYETTNLIRFFFSTQRFS